MSDEEIGVGNEEIGWAVISGRILVKTISDTRRAAIVNYLVAERGIAITNTWTDEDIEQCWRHWGGRRQCRQVRIRVAVGGSRQP